MISSLYCHIIFRQNMRLLIYKGLVITVGTVRCLYQGVEVNSLRHWGIWTCCRCLCASDSRVLYEWHSATPYSLSPKIELWGELIYLLSASIDTTCYRHYFVLYLNHGDMFLYRLVRMLPKLFKIYKGNRFSHDWLLLSTWKKILILWIFCLLGECLNFYFYLLKFEVLTEYGSSGKP